MKNQLTKPQILGERGMIKVPEKCPICGAAYRGGHEIPHYEMKEGLRVFYDCGASMSVKTIGDGVFQILLKNCRATPDKEKADDTD